MNLQGKTVVVTGGMGFLGRNVVRALRPYGCDIVTPQHGTYDLREKDDVRRMFDETDPQVVIHCAATVGGIGLNKERPGQLFYDNAIMGIHLMEEANLHHVEKYVQLGTVCAYPSETVEPFRERDLWEGYPEETNAPYGIAKRMLITMADAYRKQYGSNVITLLPVNLYGPGDHFEKEKSHVIPAIIRRFDEAIKADDKSVTLWGTGKATREFLYVKDAAEAIVRATRFYDKEFPINVGSGHSIRIDNLAELIAIKMKYYGEIKFDPSMPDGQAKRRLDVTLAKELFGFEATMPLTDGLDETIKWYKACERFL